MGTPRTGNRHFGRSSVSGRIRVDAPAARMTAFIPGAARGVRASSIDQRLQRILGILLAPLYTSRLFPAIVVEDKSSRACSLPGASHRCSSFGPAAPELSFSSLRSDACLRRVRWVGVSPCLDKAERGLRGGLELVALAKLVEVVAGAGEIV